MNTMTEHWGAIKERLKQKYAQLTDNDLALLREALSNMFDHDRSAARGVMSPVACVAFRHENALGNGRADQLFARVSCKPVDGVAANIDDGGAGKRPPRSRADFVISVQGERDLPAGITLERWV